LAIKRPFIALSLHVAVPEVFQPFLPPRFWFGVQALGRDHGGGTKRKLPHFDDLLFLGASMSRYPLEGYRERCDTSVVLGTRFAKKPIKLAIPITIAGMSFGALSGPAKEALGVAPRSPAPRRPPVTAA
jgi:hypothetical protein